MSGFYLGFESQRNHLKHSLPPQNSLWGGFLFEITPEMRRICDQVTSRKCDQFNLLTVNAMRATFNISFILSPEGYSQLWEVVMEVSKEKNYIARNCKRNKFARIVSAVCPKAGDAKKIDQNMQKYSEIDPKKSNDYTAIRSRFKLPVK